MRTVRLALLLSPLWLAQTAQAELYYVIVGGLGGEPAYANRFFAQTETLADAAARSLGDESRVTLLNGEDATREALTEALQELAQTVTAADTLAVFLVGHGTYDGTVYKYNLPGRDLDGAELGELLGAVPAGRQLVVNATSASGAVLESWAQEGRTLITATRTGGERNATRPADQQTAPLRPIQLRKPGAASTIPAPKTRPAIADLLPPSPKANIKPPRITATSASPLPMTPEKELHRAWTAVSQGPLAHAWSAPNARNSAASPATTPQRRRTSGSTTTAASAARTAASVPTTVRRIPITARNARRRTNPDSHGTLANSASTPIDSTVSPMPNERPGHTAKRATPQSSTPVPNTNDNPAF